MQKKANFLTNFLTSTWHNFSLRVKIHSTAQHSTAQHSTAQDSTAQHSTAQHSTALVLRFSGKLAKQAQLATSTSYNSARNIISGYMHFKSNITTFSHRKTAHDAGKITSCSWAFHILNLPFYVERGFGIIVFHLIFIIWQKEMRHEKNDKMDCGFSCCNDGMVRISVL